MNLIQQMINGLQIGSVYSLVALGYTMVYGIVRLINFAHGDFIMVGAYVSLMFVPSLEVAGLPVWLCVIPAVIVCIIVGVLSDKLAYKPLRGSPRISALITAIGVSLLLENLAVVIFTPNPRSFPKVFEGRDLAVGGIYISQSVIVTVITSVAVMICLQSFILKTKTGRAMRAVAEDASAAGLMGINANFIITVTFAIGAALAGLAALLYCASYPLAEPYMGTMLGLKAFVAAVLGGIGNVPGAMVGGFLLGVIESLTKAYISAKLSDAVVFLILILVLLIKPSGIFGKISREKV